MLLKIISHLKKVFKKTGEQQTNDTNSPPDENKHSLEKTISPKPHTQLHASKNQDAPHRNSSKQHFSKKKSTSTPQKQKSEHAEKPKWDLSQFQVPPSEDKTRFHDLDLHAETMHGIYDLDFKYCTPIQAAILPKALKGTDVSGRAQTGTGKSAAFLITILTRLKRSPMKDRRTGTPMALILVPTRELAMQIKKDADHLGKYSKNKVLAVFGGMDYQKQKQQLAENTIDIIVATPGRLLDFKRQGEVHLGKVEIMVIDEADHMLDMGFIPDVRQIIHSTPPKARRQTMFFGATLTPEVARLSSQWTTDPFIVEIEPEKITVDTIDQRVFLTTASEKFIILHNLITTQKPERIIIFCNRRDQTRRLADRLRANRIRCSFLSGEISQKKRIRTLEDFRIGKSTVMVATDVAGRGIHVDGISHVVNYNLPMDPEDYVHRIGRTGRAGVSGISISFATEDESFQLPPISEFIGQELHCEYPEDKLLTELPPPIKNFKPSSRHSPRPHSDQNKPNRRSNRRRSPRKKKY